MLVVGYDFAPQVVQLYVNFPPAADEPPLVLRGFERTPLLGQGEATTVTFPLRRRDLSVFDEAIGGWRLVPGTYGLRVGASSREIRLNAQLELRLSGA